MGCAVHSTLEPGQIYTTVEMKTAFVRPVRETTGTELINDVAGVGGPRDRDPVRRRCRPHA
jgi:hypothetical protein